MDSSTSDAGQPPRTLLPYAFCMRRGGLCAAAALVVTGGAFTWQASLLSFGSVGLPGPGFFPFVLGLLLAGFSGAIAAEVWRRQRPRETVVDLGHRDVLIAVAALLLVPVFFESLGAYLTLGAFAAALLIFIGRVRVIPAIAASTIGMVGIWYFFQVLLGLQLPTGPI